MNKICFCLFLFFASFLTGRLHAQSWLWGRGNTGGGVDTWPVATDPSGNVFVAGFNFGIITGSAATPTTFGRFTLPYSTATDSGFQSFMVKYDPAGNFLWAVGTQNGDTWVIDITTDKDGNSFFFGSFSSPSVQIGTYTLTNHYYSSSSHQSAYFLAKFDSLGNVLWAKSDGNAPLQGVAVNTTTYICGPGGMATDTLGNVYITTSFNLPSITVGATTLTNMDPSGSTSDILVAKYSPSGTLLWVTSSGGTNNDQSFGLTVTAAGNIYIAGFFQSPSVTFGTSTITDASGGVGNAFIAGYNSSGAPVWASGSGGIGGGEFAVGVASDATNNVYLTGGFSDDNIAFSGTAIANPYPGSSASALFLVKFNPANSVLWSKTIGDPTGNGVWGFAIAMSTCNNIWVSGSFTEELNIDGNILDAPLSGTDPVFIAGFSNAGVYAASTALQSGADDQNGIACDRSGNVYMCADYYTQPYFIVGPDTLADIGATTADELMYVAKFSSLSISSPDTNYLSQDTALCTGVNILLSAPPGYLGYIWCTGATDTSISIDSTGAYWVICYNTCTAPMVIDTFYVGGKTSDTAYSRQDTSICKDGTLLLSAPSGYFQYIWNNGTTGSALDVSDTGKYWVAAFKNCSVPLLIDTFIVSKNNLDLSFSLGDDTTTCAPLTLSVPLTGVSYLWQNGSVGSTYVATAPGNYYVTVSEDGCSNADTINVNVVNVFQYLSDTTFCSETFTQYSLYANIPSGGSALWSTGSTQPSITVNQPGQYWVTVTDAGCVGSDSMVLSTQFCDCAAFLPSAFTPNGDHLNDTYQPGFSVGCNVTNYSFSIYNRWGQQVFTSTDPTAKWDGTFQDTKAEMGVYMYYLKYNAGLNSAPHAVKGDVTLIR